MSDQFSIGFAAGLLFSTLLYTYSIALGWAWRASAGSSKETRRGARAKLRVLDEQTRPATTVTLYFAASVIVGALVGKIL